MAKKDRSVPRDMDVRLQVMKAECGRYYVDARAGTGKTESLANRVAYALQQQVDGERKYLPSDILCVTFTNGAEDEMRRRVKAILTKEGSGLEKEVNSIYIGNIHKFCLRFLKTIGKGIHPFTIIDDISLATFVDNESSLEYETTSRRHNKGTVTMDEVRKYAAMLRQRQEGHPPAVRLRYFTRIPKSKKAALESVADQYIAYKKEHNYCDFDDILIDTYSRLREKGAREKYPKMSSYKWIQVDEVQDLNPLQHGIILKLLAGRKSTICYYGDMNQAIFSFLGTAGKNALKQFRNDEEDGHHFEFRENFRSPNFLVKVFDRYISAYLNPSPSNNAKIKSRIRPLDRLHIYEFSEDAKERAHIAEAVTKILEYNKKNPGTARRRTAAILVRTGDEADKVSRALLHYPYKPLQRANAKNKDADAEIGIPHLKVSGSDSLKRDAIMTLLSHFSLVNDEFDRWAWARILYHLHCGGNFTQSRAIASSLHSLGFLPSDFMSEGSTYLRAFFEAANSDCVVYRVVDDTLYAMKLSNGTIQQGLFSGPTSKTGDCYEAFIDFVGDSSIISFESEITIASLPSRLRKGTGSFDSNNVWSLKKTSRLFSENEAHEDSFSFLTSRLPYCDAVPSAAPDLFRRTVSLLLHHMKLAESKLAEQDAYLSHLGGQYLSQKVKEVYGPVFIHSRTLLESQSMRDSDKRLADEFRWAYKALLKKNIIHNFNPQIIDRKKMDHASGIDPYNFSGKFDEDAFNSSWDKVIKEDQRQTEIKTEYFFEYLQKSVFAEGSKKLVRTLLDEHLQEIKFIGESDLCQQPFVKESIYVMTVHQAKGHEFTDVFIAGASDQSYPFYGHKSKWEIDEDKRLFYVAMTRSRNNLTVSYSKSYISAYDNRKFSASITPFVEDIAEYFNVETDSKRKDGKNIK